MTNEKINRQIVNLWNKYFQNDSEVYAPLFYDELKKGAITFVGMNPSFSKRGFKVILEGTEYAKIIPEAFLKWSNISLDPKFIEDCIKIENYAYANYTMYFRRLADIAKHAESEWQHIDLFLYKETSQTNFMTRILDEKGDLNEFERDQIALFEDVLMETEPRCVVVINATGSALLRKHIKNELEWDESRGFHWFTRGGKKVPIFFSSMLSGQRMLDRWSYERLRWHVAQAVKV